MYSWIYAILSGLLFFQGLSLFFRKVGGNFKFLGIFFILFSYQLLTAHLRLGGLMEQLPHFFKTGSLPVYLFGPFIYFFLRASVDRDFRIKPKHFVHFIPFLFHLVELFPFFLLSADEKSLMYAKQRNQSQLILAEWGYFSYRIHIVLKSALIFAYTLGGYYVIKPLVNDILTFPNRQDRLFGIWIKWFIWVLLISYALIFFTYSLYWFLPKQLQFLGNFVYFAGPVLCAAFFLFFPEISGWKIHMYAANADRGGPLEVFGTLLKKDNLSVEFSELLLKVLEEHYSDTNLDVGKLARLLLMSERNLFRRIKDILGSSPNEVLNDFRIQKAYLAIKADPSKSIGTIMLETGFTSNGYFSRRFKERYGVLPSEFQKSCRDVI